MPEPGFLAIFEDGSAGVVIGEENENVWIWSGGNSIPLSKERFTQEATECRKATFSEIHHSIGYRAAKKAQEAFENNGLIE